MIKHKDAIKGGLLWHDEIYIVTQNYKLYFWLYKAV